MLLDCSHIVNIKSLTLFVKRSLFYEGYLTYAMMHLTLPVQFRPLNKRL